MKYVILIYSNPASWEHPMFLHQGEELTNDEREVRMGKFTDLLRQITESGELVDSAPLADPGLTCTIRVRDGVRTVTDGPFVDAKEHLAGYFVVDCASPERAAEIAAGFPDASYSAVEVRPIMSPSGAEM